MEALHLVFIFLFIGLCLYGFYKLRGTVKIFVVFVLLFGLILWWLYRYMDSL